MSASRQTEAIAFLFRSHCLPICIPLNKSTASYLAMAVRDAF
jgi:hypothetical protein